MHKTQAIIECCKVDHPLHNSISLDKCFKCDNFIKFELGYIYCKSKGE